MTQDQFMALLRQVLPFLGGIAVGKGWLTPDQAASLGTLALQIGGPLFVVGGSVWAFVANNKKNILISAANMPEVKHIMLDATKPETAELNTATPANVKV